MGQPAGEADQYEYMATYSPYDNVARAPTRRMLVTVGLNDSQVMYWEPAKWVARLRDGQPGQQADSLENGDGRRSRRAFGPL